MIAQTILKQLGGNRFIAMTGSKNLLDCGNALQMHLTRNKAKAKSLRIQLADNDTYTMTFQTWDKNYNLATVAEETGVYCDQLQSVFTQITGLDTHL